MLEIIYASPIQIPLTDSAIGKTVELELSSIFSTRAGRAERIKITAKLTPDYPDLYLPESVIKKLRMAVMYKTSVRSPSGNIVEHCVYGSAILRIPGYEHEAFPSVYPIKSIDYALLGALPLFQLGLVYDAAANCLRNLHYMEGASL